MVGVHAVTTTLGEVLDVAESKLAATILVSLELGDGSISGFSSIEAHDTGTSGAAARFVLDLGLLDLSDGSEELDQVLIAGGPRKLRASSACMYEEEFEVMGQAYVSDVDRLASLRTSCGEVGERVGRDGGSSTGIETAATNCTNWTTCSHGAAESTSSAKAATKAAAASPKSATATETAAESATASSEATTAAEAHVGVGKTVRTHLEDATLPVVTIELLNSVAGVVGGFEDNNAGALGPSIGTEVHVGTNDTTGASWSVMYRVSHYSNLVGVICFYLTCLSEQVLQVLPSDGVGQLRKEVSGFGAVQR